MGVTVILLSDGSDGRGEPPSLSFDAPRLVIGRGDGCEVRLPDPSVSGRHASLRQHGGTYLLVDEGSTNGTFLGEVRLSAHAPRVVSDGDRVRVGRVWLELRLAVVAASSSAHDTRELALGLVQRALEQQGDDAGLTLALTRPGVPLLLGRGHGVDLSLDEPDASRRHLQVTRKADQVWLRDLGSKNGTHLNGQRLTPERDTLWRASDTLSIGEDILAFEHPALEALAELERCADE
ncbi:MAG: FHA domain-containing protein, partial [Myxococcales bacterium]